jgi:hypothetical protein
LRGLSQDEAIALLRRKLIAVQNPADLERPFKLKFGGVNRPYEIAVAALREEITAQEEALHLLTMKVRTQDLKHNYEKLQQGEIVRSELDQERLKLQQDIAVCKNIE